MRRAVILVCLAVVAALGGRSAIDGSAGAEPDRLRGRVVSVVDGDTLHVRAGGRQETVRLIGIDTPETHRPGTPVECGGPAATAAVAPRVRRGTPALPGPGPTPGPPRPPRPRL